MTLPQVVLQGFDDQFGGQPLFLVRAPGRVNLIGEHTDYNEGFVLPMAIDRAIWIALRPRDDWRVRVHSLDYGDALEFSLEGFEKGQGWGEYVKGVAWALDHERGKRKDEKELSGWEGVVGG
ncbi:MAG: galactokinase, partial [Chloroflexi bacterium]|nr:galactokinase [Chloroflexota bacterium]